MTSTFPSMWLTMSGAIGSATTNYATDGKGGVTATPESAAIIIALPGSIDVIDSILVTTQTTAVHEVEIVKFDGSSFSPALSIPIPAAPASLPYSIAFGRHGAQLPRGSTKGGFGVKIPDLVAGALTVTVFFHNTN